MPKFIVNISLLFTQHPIMDRFQLARDTGFQGVEILTPYSFDAHELALAATSANCPIHLINAPFGPEWGHGADPNNRDTFRTEIGHAVNYATILQAKHIHVLSGIKGDLKTLRENLIWATSTYPNQSFLIEPINTFDIPDYKLNNFDDAIEILRAVNAPNLGLQFDTYHASRMTKMSATCPTDVLRMSHVCLPWIKHIQVSGNPGRSEPDQGVFDHVEFFRKLDVWGYDGMVGAEYKPTSGSFDWLAKAR